VPLSTRALRNSLLADFAGIGPRAPDGFSIGEPERRAAPVGQAGAALFQHPAEATEEWQESDAEDARTTLAVPAKALAAGRVGLREQPQDMIDTWPKHPRFGWGRIPSFNKKSGNYMVVFEKATRNAKAMEAGDLAETMTTFLGKGAATRCCTSHDSMLYTRRSTPSCTASSTTC
jgi:hypothetical protein